MFHKVTNAPGPTKSFALIFLLHVHKVCSIVGLRSHLSVGGTARQAGVAPPEKSGSANVHQGAVYKLTGLAGDVSALVRGGPGQGSV